MFQTSIKTFASNIPRKRQWLDNGWASRSFLISSANFRKSSSHHRSRSLEVQLSSAIHDVRIRYHVSTDTSGVFMGRVGPKPLKLWIPRVCLSPKICFLIHAAKQERTHLHVHAQAYIPAYIQNCGMDTALGTDLGLIRLGRFDKI